MDKLPDIISYIVATIIALYCLYIIFAEIKNNIHTIKKDVYENEYTGRKKHLYILSRFLFGKDENEDTKNNKKGQ